MYSRSAPPESTHLHLHADRYGLRSQAVFLLTVPKVQPELEKKAFKDVWNNQQKTMKLTEPVPLKTFKGALDALLVESSCL